MPVVNKEQIIFLLKQEVSKHYYSPFPIDHSRSKIDFRFYALTPLILPRF